MKEERSLSVEVGLRFDPTAYWQPATQRPEASCVEAQQFRESEELAPVPRVGILNRIRLAIVAYRLYFQVVDENIALASDRENNMPASCTLTLAAEHSRRTTPC